MSTLADILGLPHQIGLTDKLEDSKGKVYKLSVLTLEGRATFTRWLEKRAREEAVRAVADLPDESAKRAYIQAITQDIASGTYEFGGEACYKALGSGPGKIYAVYLSLLENYPDATEELAAELLEKRELEIGMIIKQKIEENDPKVIAALRGMTRGSGVGPQSHSQTNRTKSRSKKSKNSRRRK